MISISILFLGGCFDPDPDDDQLLSADEANLGTDPSNPDSDGDGLKDGHEVYFHRTDPLQADSDGDGGDDGWEFVRGLDPNSASSHGYTGGWPMLTQAEKSALETQPAPLQVEVGQRISRERMFDQHGDEYDLYDLAKSNKYTILTGSAAGIGLLVDVNDRRFGQPEWLRDYILDGTLQCVGLHRIETNNQTSFQRPGSGSFMSSYETANSICIAVVDWKYSMHIFLGSPSDEEAFYLLDDRMIVRAIDDFDEMKRLIDAGLPAPAED
jgi:hypothetical protein